MRGLVARFRRQRDPRSTPSVRDPGPVGTTDGRAMPPLAWFRAVADTTTDVVVVVSQHGHDGYLNPAARSFFGIDILPAMSLESIVAPEQRLVAEQAILAVRAGDTWTGDLTVVGMHGTHRTLSVTMTGCPDGTGDLEAIVLVGRAGPAQQVAGTDIGAGATPTTGQDQLTGLPHRQQLLDALATDLATETPVAVLVGGLDGFKLINDSVGHGVGDEILRTVTARLLAAARPDDLVARLGGDEFVVVRRGSPADRDDATDVARRCIDAVGAPIQIDDHEHVVAMSMGIALRDESATASQLLQKAELAMRSAKASGRGRSAVFDVAMRVRADERAELERDLRRALEHGEIELRFQPIVDTTSGAVDSFEALARWRHPTRGIVMPREFMPIVETGGFAAEFGEIVVRAATDATARLRAVQADITTSVNMSPGQLLDEQVVTVTSDALTAAGLTADALTIEITEETVMDDLHAVRSRLDALRSLGVRFAIDDFGTGYSNLTMLHQFAADYVKIDRSLVEGDATLLRLVLSLTGELGFASIAEGVETAEQLERLRSLGCRLAQGYLMAEPLVLDDALALLERHSADSG